MINLEKVFMYFGIIAFAAMFVYLFYQVYKLNQFKARNVDSISELYRAIDEKAPRWMFDDTQRRLDHVTESMMKIDRELHPEKYRSAPDPICYTDTKSSL